LIGLIDQMPIFRDNEAMMTLKLARLTLVGLVLVVGAACRGGATPTLTPEIEGPPDGATSTPAPGGDTPTEGSSPGVTGVYYGQFDCTGMEAGLLAYAGRFSLDEGGSVSFRDYDGGVHTGTYAYDDEEQAYTFSTGFVMSFGEYFVDDTMTAVPAEGANLPHTEGSEINCVRAEPGVTGPP
jgi:hypothetical protein